MIRIPREQLNAAIDAFFACGEHATDVEGLRVTFPMSRLMTERAILAALSMLTTVGPVTAADVFFGGPNFTFWPPKPEKTDADNPEPSAG